MQTPNLPTSRPWPGREVQGKVLQNRPEPWTLNTLNPEVRSLAVKSSWHHCGHLGIRRQPVKGANFLSTALWARLAILIGLTRRLEIELFVSVSCNPPWGRAEGRHSKLAFDCPAAATPVVLVTSLPRQRPKYPMIFAGAGDPTKARNMHRHFGGLGAIFNFDIPAQTIGIRRTTWTACRSTLAEGTAAPGLQRAPKIRAEPGDWWTCQNPVAGGRFWQSRSPKWPGLPRPRRALTASEGFTDNRKERECSGVE